MAGGDAKSVEVAPGADGGSLSDLKPALYFAGIVVNEQGKPIPGVKIAANRRTSTSGRRSRENREPSGWVVRTLQLSREPARVQNE